MDRNFVTVEIGGRTRVGRLLKKMLTLGTSRATPARMEKYEKAREDFANAVFRKALREGWRP